ncbi:hypothetical protein DH2020_015239 [Rehmannia glutinosa]|uniref:Uncharacterized protein n=1 Tax=Rehmannia glutinosa TaxID=99300 RepID=A0ABR0WS70_REHGL
MGLGQLASRALIRSTRLTTSKPSHLLRRTIVSTPDLHNAEAAAAAQPETDLPKRNPVAGARVHFPNPDDAIEVFVDGYPVKIPKGMTVLQACEIAGVDIPRFCYHSRLSIAGNCRMCLVEVEKSPKPVASCAMPALPGMKIKTDTPLAKKAREGVMEFLLMNHPLDCPICDQGGECDLQDQSMAFGSDRGRFTETKRSVVDKNLGPLVKTVMTRCIQCTRCVRFATEVAGVQDLGMLGRGSGEEIGTYVERLMTTRNWELKGTESIDVTDAVGSNIRIDSRGPEVMRIVPRLNEDINEEWISDKTRFFYDGLKRQRLNDPMIRGADGRFKAVSWRDALAVVAEVVHQVKPEEIVGVAGKLSDAESMMALKDFLNTMGSNNIWCEGNGPNPNADLRSGYIMNTSIGGLEKADVFLLVGTQTISKNINAVRPDWNGLNTLLLNAAQAAALDLGLIPESDKSIESAKFLYLMGADDVNLEKLPDDAFVVYQGHHGDRGVYRANVILPSSAFSEKEGTYVNTEGCAQTTVPAVPTVGDARDDWKIIRALSEVAGVRLPYDTVGAIRSRMSTVAPNLLNADEREAAAFSSSFLRPEVKEKMDKTPFGIAVENFYMTDAITRASKIMAQCSALLKKVYASKCNRYAIWIRPWNVERSYATNLQKMCFAVCVPNVYVVRNCLESSLSSNSREGTMK